MTTINEHTAALLCTAVSERYNSNAEWQSTGWTADSLRYMGSVLLGRPNVQDQRAGYLASCVAEELAGINGECWAWTLEELHSAIHAEAARLSRVA